MKATCGIFAYLKAPQGRRNFRVGDHPPATLSMSVKPCEQQCRVAVATADSIGEGLALIGVERPVLACANGRGRQQHPLR
jgi:hypothetical protein